MNRPPATALAYSNAHDSICMIFAIKRFRMTWKRVMQDLKLSKKSAHLVHEVDKSCSLDEQKQAD